MRECHRRLPSVHQIWSRRFPRAGRRKEEMECDARSREDERSFVLACVHEGTRCSPRKALRGQRSRIGANLMSILPGIAASVEKQQQDAATAAGLARLQQYADEQGL